MIRNYYKYMRTHGLAGLLLIGWGATIGCSSGSEETTGSSTAAGLTAPSRHEDGDRGERGESHDCDHDQKENESCSIAVPRANVIQMNFSNNVDAGRVSLSSTFTNDVKTHEFQSDQRFQVNGHEVFHRVFDLKADKSFHATFDYGAHFSGPKHVEVSSVDGKIATAIVDGRPTLPFSLAKTGTQPIVRFSNGKPVPVNEIHGEDLDEDARRLFQDAARDSAACFNPKLTEAASELVAANAPTTSLQIRAAALSLTQTPGGQFPGEPTNSVVCGAAYAGGVLAEFLACGYLIGAAAPSCGPFV